MAKSSRRAVPEVNASSMADIAFLLLIFFLVSTEIAEDKGLLVRLPPWSDEEPEVLTLNERNVFSVLVNSQNQLLVRNELTSIDQLRERAKEFIINPQNRPDLAASPTKAIISLKNDRGTEYETYLAVYNELQAAYNELWTEESLRRFGVPYSEDLPIAVRREIRNKIPLVLSEAEPTSFGAEN